MGIFSRLSEIGKEVASLWGGTCKKVEINTDDKVVQFLCTEHKEEFVTSMTFDEIKKEYGLLL